MGSTWEATAGSGHQQAKKPTWAAALVAFPQREPSALPSDSPTHPVARESSHDGGLLGHGLAGNEPREYRADRWSKLNSAEDDVNLGVWYLVDLNGPG